MRGAAEPGGGGTPRVALGLRVSAGICASASLVALVAHVAGLLPMPYFLQFFGVPSVLLLFALAAYARRIDAGVFVTALWVGLWGGLVATLAYDVFRFVVQQTRLLSYDGFAAITIFGGWITGKPRGSLEAAVAGWVYHFWNGLAFGVFYVLTFGRRRWLYGVGYGLVIEACMLGLFPLFVAVSNRVDFVVVSLLGHVVYGAMLGRIAQAHAVSWRDVRRRAGRRRAAS